MQKGTMAASEENSALFPIFILTIMAIPIVPYTITKLCRAASKKSKSIHCHCSECSRSGKYHKSIFKRVRSFLLCVFRYFLQCLLGFTCDIESNSAVTHTCFF